MTSVRPAVLAPGGSRRRRRPGISWTMLTARASAHSSRRVTTDISGPAPPTAGAAPPGSDPIGLVPGASDLDRGLGMVPVDLGDQLFLAACARFGDDVLERFHLLGGEAAPLLDHTHARHRRFDDQRTEDPGEQRNDERGAKPEKKRRRMDLHQGPPDLARRLPAGSRSVCYVCVTAGRN